MQTQASQYHLHVQLHVHAQLHPHISLIVIYVDTYLAMVSHLPKVLMLLQQTLFIYLFIYVFIYLVIYLTAIIIAELMCGVHQGNTIAKQIW